MFILGIESSCDETAAAVVQDGETVLSSVIASQIDTHHKYGGVVPELASRMHAEAITPVVDQALKQADTDLSCIDAIAATRGPGLVGALLVGFSFAKALAWARQLPLIGVNHLEAPSQSLFLTDNPPRPPFIALVVSGGHTNIYHVVSRNQFELLGMTRDDAAGEAFDKVAKMLGLGYPGGPVIERIAGTLPDDARRFPRTLLDKGSLDFSFSGLKSAVARFIHEHPPQSDEDRAAVAAAFQHAVMDVIAAKLIRAARAKHCHQIALTGGVAANATLVKNVRQQALKHKIETFSPPPELCGDNAAMIAGRGFSMFLDGHICKPDHDVFSRTRI